MSYKDRWLYQVQRTPCNVTVDDIGTMGLDGTLPTRIADETIVDFQRRRCNFPPWFDLLDVPLQSAIIHSLGERFRNAHAVSKQPKVSSGVASKEPTPPTRSANPHE